METGAVLTLERGLADVSAAIDRAGTAPLMSATDSDLLAALAATPGLRNKLDSLVAKITRSAEQTRAVNRDDSRNVANWIGANTSAPPRISRADVRTARWLEGFGEFSAAHHAGVLGREHIRLLRHADTPITRLALLRDQEILVNAAKTCSFGGFQVAVQYWINAADPDGQLPNEQVRENELSVTRRDDGSISFKGQLDPLLGTAVKKAIDAEFEKIAADSTATISFVSRGSQRATALANIVSRGATRADGTLPAPLINVVVSEQVAEDLVEGLVPHIDPNDLDGRCEFLDGTPLHPAFAAKLMPRAIFRRAVFDATSRAIDVSVNARLFPRWMKDIALIQSRGRCAEPGCDAPTSWLQADHIHPHSKHGATELANVQPLCGPSNRAKRDKLPPDESEQKPDKPAA